MKLTERKFAWPALSVVLALVNDAAKLGYDFKLIVLIVAAALAWAGLEYWKDVQIARLKPPKA